MLCGAAARTRVAPAPNWKPLIAALAVVIVLSLGVLAAALVKLAGDSASVASAPASVVATAPAAAGSVAGAAASTALAPATSAAPTAAASARAAGARR